MKNKVLFIVFAFLATGAIGQSALADTSCSPEYLQQLQFENAQLKAELQGETQEQASADAVSQVASALENAAKDQVADTIADTKSKAEKVVKRKADEASRRVRDKAVGILDRILNR